MKIEIQAADEGAPLMLTPAGVVYKRFPAKILDFKHEGLNVLLDIEIREAHESKGNRILVRSFRIDSFGETSPEITSDLLKNIAVKSLAEECVKEAIKKYFPKSLKSKSLGVPTAEEVSRVELVAAISSSLGVSPSAKLIQKELLKHGVQMEERTVSNYLTKARKLGLLDTKKILPNQLPEILRGQTPGTMSLEAEGIISALITAASNGTVPVSPKQKARKKEAEAEFLAKKRKADIARRNTPKAKKGR